MGRALLPVALLIIVSAAGQDADQHPAKGIIYGMATAPDGNPAKGIRLAAYPVLLAHKAIPPHTRTDQLGRYRFENVPLNIQYVVSADDLAAGYFPVIAGNGTEQSKVSLSAENPEAELNVQLPPRAGFLRIHPTNRKTGTAIPSVRVTLKSAEYPSRVIFVQNCSSAQSVLIPPDTEFFLHVTSPGFREWDQSAGPGKPIRMSSGSQMNLDVQLDSADRGGHQF